MKWSQKATLISVTILGITELFPRRKVILTKFRAELPRLKQAVIRETHLAIQNRVELAHQSLKRQTIN